MRKLSALLMLIPAILFGQAAFDVSLQQVNAGGTEFNEVLVSPAASSLMGFSSGKIVGNVTLTANDFNLAAGVLSLDYTNGQKATALVPGFLSSADWSTFNGKESVLTFTSPLSRSVNTISLLDTAVTPGSYTSTNLTVDSKGRITAASNGAGSSALSSITAATGANTIASGNNTGQVWNWANTSNSTTAFTFGETTAATNGTSTSGIPNQVLLKLTTLASSTMSPLSVYSRGNHAFSVSPTDNQILATSVSSGGRPPYSFAASISSGIEWSGSLDFRVSGGLNAQMSASSLAILSGDTNAPSLTNWAGGVTGLFWPSVSGGHGIGICDQTDNEWVRWISFIQQASRGDDSSTAYALNFRKARGAVNSPTVITTGDDLATLTGYGYVGSTNTYLPAAQILFDSTGTIADSTTGIGGQIKFYTTLAGTDTSPQLNMTLAGGSTPTADLVGKVTTYNNVATAGQGLSTIYGAGRATAQTAANSSIATYTVGSSDGSFIISANVLVTASTTHNFSVECAYTDEGNTARVVTFNVQQLGGTLVTAITNVTGVGPYEGVPLHIRAKASTSITIRTNSGGTYTSVTYNAEGVIQQIQ